MEKVEPGKRVKPPEGYKRKLRLFGQRWTVEYVSTVRVDDEDCWGCSFHPDRKIYVAVTPATCEGFLRDTLLHEILHSYLRHTGCWSDGEPTLPKGDGAEESTVVAFTTAFVDLLNSNAWVRKLLCR